MKDQCEDQLFHSEQILNGLNDTKIQRIYFVTKNCLLYLRVYILSLQQERH